MLQKPTFHTDLSKQLPNVVGGVMTPPYDGDANIFNLLPLYKHEPPPVEGVCCYFPSSWVRL